MDHSAYLCKGSMAVRKRGVLLAEEDLEEILAGALVQVLHQLQQATKMGAWLMVQPSAVNRTEMGVQEWQYVLFF